MLDRQSPPSTSHELGHSLGFVHEHDRRENAANHDESWCHPHTLYSYVALTSYDPYSVMHYSECGGRGVYPNGDPRNNMTLSTQDGRGAGALYGKPGESGSLGPFYYSFGATMLYGTKDGFCLLSESGLQSLGGSPAQLWQGTFKWPFMGLCATDPSHRLVGPFRVGSAYYYGYENGASYCRIGGHSPSVEAKRLAGGLLPPSLSRVPSGARYQGSCTGSSTQTPSPSCTISVSGNACEQELDWRASNAVTCSWSYEKNGYWYSAGSVSCTGERPWTPETVGAGAGRYRVRLTARSADGRSSTCTTASFDIAARPPTCSLEAQPSTAGSRLVKWGAGGVVDRCSWKYRYNRRLYSAGDIFCRSASYMWTRSNVAHGAGQYQVYFSAHGQCGVSTCQSPVFSIY